MSSHSLFKSALLVGVLSCALPGGALANECERFRRIAPPPPFTQQTLTGTKYGDLLVGGDSSWDTIRGYQNADSLIGLKGNDALFGNPGNDFLDGGAGDDCLDGGRGDDELRGGSGADLYWFDIGDGQDTVYDFDNPTGTLVFSRRVPWLSLRIDAIDDLVIGYQLESSVRVHGGATGSGIGSVRFAGTTYRLRVGTAGQDVLFGDDGADWLHGDAGRDGLLGNGGDDRLHGGAGDDVLYGLGGDDTLFGEGGDDDLWGGSGSDRLDGGSGSDELQGERGSDGYVFSGGAGFDTVSELGDPSDVDTLEFPRVDPRDVQLSYGEPSALIVDYAIGDRVTVEYQYASSAAGYDYGVEKIRVGDQVYGFLLGSLGADLLVGGDGNDMLFGDDSASAYQVGDDSLIGGAGNDFLWGRGGRDTLHGGTGDDTLIGGVFPDSLFGGQGDDTYLYLADDEMEAWQPGEEIRDSGPATDVDTLEIERIALDRVRLTMVDSDLLASFTVWGATQRVWIRDQFAGSGIERVEAGGWIVPVAPLLALFQENGDAVEFRTTAAGYASVRELNWNGAVGAWIPLETIESEAP